MKSILLLAFVVSSAVAHSYLSVPVSRTNQAQSQTGCRGPACVGPCDGGNTRVVGTVARGSSITTKWPRNNHAGGFIRFAWAPTSESGSHSAFDSRATLFTCHERGKVAGGTCAPGNGGDPNGGDSISSADPSGHCSAQVPVPDFATDGGWTLQWAWFGGAFALGDYYSCVDYTISGGNPVNGNIPAPAFQGSDFANPNDNAVCKTFNTDALHRCRNEPCDNPVFSGAKNMAPAGVSGGGTPPPINPTVAPTPNGNGKCYSSPALAKNLQGPVQPVCGQNGAGNRCADNLCCSKFGYCGATSDYCSENQGDWRLTPCSGSGGMCYNGNTGLNLNGALSVNGRCGTSARGSRCADGQCCSQYGYCGSGNDYCNRNQGDWTLVTCDGNKNISPRDAIYSNSTVDDAEIFGSSGKVVLGLLSAAALAL